MDTKLNQVQEIAARLVAAEISSGPRIYWVHEITTSKLDAVVDTCIRIAERIVAKTTISLEPPK